MKILQPTIDKLQSWKRSLKYRENSFYQIITDPTVDPNSDKLLIQLLKAPYSGIIYSYGSISIGEDLGYRGSQASYTVDIHYPRERSEELIFDSKFNKITGEILLNILEKAISAQANEYIKENLDEEVREDYSEEFVPQRTVSSKNSTVSKKRVHSGQKREGSVRGSKKVRSKVQSDSDA